MKKLVREIMLAEINAMQKQQLPAFRVGQKVTVQYKTSNGDERLFRGIVIGRENKGISSNVSILHPHQNPGLRLLQKFLIYSPLLKFTIDEQPKRSSHRATRFDLINSFGKKLKKL